MLCPKCGFERAEGARECPRCRIIFEKWNARPARVRATGAPIPPAPGVRPAAEVRVQRAYRVLLIVFALAMGYLLVRQAPLQSGVRYHSDPEIGYAIAVPTGWRLAFAGDIPEFLEGFPTMPSAELISGFAEGNMLALLYWPDPRPGFPACILVERLRTPLFSTEFQLRAFIARVEGSPQGSLFMGSGTVEAMSLVRMAGYPAMQILQRHYGSMATIEMSAVQAEAVRRAGGGGSWSLPLQVEAADLRVLSAVLPMRHEKLHIACYAQRGQFEHFQPTFRGTLTSVRAIGPNALGPGFLRWTLVLGLLAVISLLVMDLTSTRLVFVEDEP